MRAIVLKLLTIIAKLVLLRCILSDWEYVRSRDWSESEVRKLKKLLPVSANKVKVNILRRKEDSFIITVGVFIIVEMIGHQIYCIRIHSYTQGKWSR